MAEALQARKKWRPIFNILKEKNFQPRISYPAKLSFVSKGEIKSFTDKQLLRDFITTRPALQELLKEAVNMKQLVPATAKTYQTVKTFDTVKITVSYITILTLNIKEVNAAIKRHRLANWIKTQDPSVCCIQETHLTCKNTYRLKIK